MNNSKTRGHRKTGTQKERTGKGAMEEGSFHAVNTKDFDGHQLKNKLVCIRNQIWMY